MSRVWVGSGASRRVITVRGMRAFVGESWTNKRILFFPLFLLSPRRKEASDKSGFLTTSFKAFGPPPLGDPEGRGGDHTRSGRGH